MRDREQNAKIIIEIMSHEEREQTDKNILSNMWGHPLTQTFKSITKGMAQTYNYIIN